MRFVMRAGALLAGAGFVALGCSGDDNGSAATSGNGGAGAASSTTSSSGGNGNGGSAGRGSGGDSSGGSGGSAGAGGQPPDDPCAAAADGGHCGADLGGLADHASLYACVGGATVSVQGCANGCEQGACTQPPSDPCASAQSGNGPYCGESLQGGTPGTLYNCQSGATASQQVCASGCQVNPPLVADECAATGDPCVSANAGNGLYCGSSLGAGSPNTLYDCQSGATASSMICPNGCQMMPPNTPDACAPNPGQCCLNRPPGALTQAYSACGNGGSHYGIDYGTPIGTPIYAGMAGTVVAQVLGFPNCYNNGCSQSCWNAFNYIKLKADCGDPNNPANDFYVYYLHIDNVAPGVGNGTHLGQGELLAYAGNSGCSSGPHIHIESVSVPQNSPAYLNQCTSVNPATRYCP